MGRYNGFIGYGVTSESKPGVWTTTITEREVFGDSIINNKRSENNEQLNDNIAVNKQISFLADPYALHNFHLIKYATYLGTKWKVISASEQYPRLVLTLGGVYNDE